MLNRFPLWKNLAILFIVLGLALYASPNLFGEDPAVQISGVRGTEVTEQQLSQVRQELESAGIDYKSVALENGQVLVRLTDPEVQLRAREALKQALGEEFIVALNLAPATPGWLEAIGASPLKLGLDLRGGVHFLMEVDMNAALANQRQQVVADFRAELREEKIRYASIRELSSGEGVIASFRDEETRDQAETFLSRRHQQLLFDTSESGGRYHLTATESEEALKEMREYALQQNITILRNRVNELGVAEPLVQRQGADRIVVELPGVQDTARAKEILGATATLEFRMVNDDADVSAAVAGRVPAGSKLYYDRDGRPMVLESRVILTGDHIVDANSGFDEYSRPQVNISLDATGGSKMSRSTKSNVGRPMATVFIEYKPTDKVDENGKTIFEQNAEVINAATIQSQLGRSFRITGIGSQAEAHNLALLLRAGALTAPIQIVEERTVGPSMGEANIAQGMTSIVYGLAVVVGFMVFYYRKFGLIANTALVMNLVLIVGIMSLIPGATLTLPGIAGIVLTIGTAVDANVLIFERIREEMRAGRSVQQAIDQGYGNAFSSIFDANITTLITALILYGIGTGPVKGFALTLSIGLATSMFTAIVGTRAIVNAAYGGKRLKDLSI